MFEPKTKLRWRTVAEYTAEKEQIGAEKSKSMNLQRQEKMKKEQALLETYLCNDCAVDVERSCSHCVSIWNAIENIELQSLEEN